MGETVRSVGYISQTIQCVHDGKISWNIRIQAKVIRDLYSIFDVDCIASSRTYARLVGKQPKPPDDPRVTHLDDNMEDDNIAREDDKSSCEEERIIESSCDAERVIDSADAKEGATANTNDDAIVEAKKEENLKYDEAYLSYISSLPVYQPSKMTSLREWRKIPKVGNFKNVMVYETSPGECNDSSSDEDDDNFNEDHEEDADHLDDHYRAADYRDPDPGETFCKFCFVSGQSISVTHSHNVLDVTCPSMSHVDKERIHGPNWLAKMHGYND